MPYVSIRENVRTLAETSQKQERDALQIQRNDAFGPLYKIQEFQGPTCPQILAQTHGHVTLYIDRYINCCFVVRYDVDKSGAIDKKEMVKVMNSIYSMLGDDKGGNGQGGMNDMVGNCQ